MNTKTKTAEVVGSSEEVRPAAWWALAENGNIRCWTTKHPEALRLASEIGHQLLPLYDHAALSNAMNAEREQCALQLERLGQHELAQCLRNFKA